MGVGGLYKNICQGELKTKKRIIGKRDKLQTPNLITLKGWLVKWSQTLIIVITYGSNPKTSPQFL